MTRCAIRRHLVLAALALTLTAAGCGDDGGTAPGPQPEPPGGLMPLNDTPANTMLRMEKAYETEALAEYVALFTADFSFRFSAQSDPVLVNQFGTSWGVVHDSTSARHLFDGFTNDVGEFMPGATTISMFPSGTQIIADPDHPDSSAHYRYVIVPSLAVDFDFGGLYDYSISAPHDFYLVRGDAAVRRPGQAADSTRWYIRRWDDKSLPLAARRTPGAAAPAGVLPASAVSWGAVKATYLL